MNVMSSKEASKLIGEALGIDLSLDTDVTIHLPLSGAVKIERKHLIESLDERETNSD